MKKITLILILAMVIGTVSGCKDKKDSASVIDKANYFNFNQYSDSDDVPDWKGEKIRLKKWVQANNTSATNKGRVSSNDVVTPEIERITGVSFDSVESFDNAAGSYDARVVQMIAAGDYPDMAESLPELSGLVKKGVLWRLDKLVEQYAPNIYKLFGPDSSVYGIYWKQQMEQLGGVYAVSTSSVKDYVREMTEIDRVYDLTADEIDGIAGPGNSPYGYVYMRDDILKKLYPNAHTVAELEAIYNENGKFTIDEILDVPLESPQDFINMLYKIKDMNLKDGTAEVYPIYTHTGGDNWPVLSTLGGMFRYFNASGANYFSYYNLQEKTIKYTFKETWFKDLLKMYNTWLRDGVASKEALLDTDAIFREKLNNGRYIVSYGAGIPTKDALAGRFAYRKVYAKYKSDDKKFLFPKYADTLNKLSFFNTNLTENQMIQVLRALDFMASQPGQKLTYWGPKKAGLYTTDSNGKMQYKDENLRNSMLQETIYGYQESLKYGLKGGAWPGYFYVAASNYQPGRYYSPITSWEQAFKPELYEKQKFIVSVAPNIYSTDVIADIPEAKRFWTSRKAFEDALLKVFAANTDAEFEARYNEAIQIAEKNGLTAETLATYNKLYTEKYNKNFMDYIKEITK